MTDKEKAIVMAHTGICMLKEDKFYIFHKYVEELMGRPILTHEIGWLADAIKEKSKVDFMALCADESSGQKPCDDTVSREDAKSFLYERLNRLNNDELYDIFSVIIDDMYNELPSVQPKSGWISVSERLPEKGGAYLVTTEWKGSYSGDVYTETNMAVYREKEKEWDCAGVIAWQPLPEPYEPTN